MTENAMQPWTKERLVSLLDSSDLAVARALSTIFARQTPDEQDTLRTKHSNGRGFSSADAEILSDIAQKLPRYNNRMTPRQTAFVRGRVKRYWRQLLEEIEAKGQPVVWPGRSKTVAPSADDLEERLAAELARNAEPAEEGAWA
jgi:sulfite reductase beta subunit-like hemoprotein